MKITSVNISGKLSDAEIALYDAVHQAAAQLKAPYLVVGATARDLVMHHGFGARVQRATTDADFGIQVADWPTFDVFKRELTERGFQATKLPHRLLSPNSIAVDLVPFGAIADQDSAISWPPENAFKMEVLGFQEACDHALSVCIREEPNLTIKVASPAGMVLMKLIAWKDRSADLRKKDADDFHYLIQNYEKIPEISDALYATEELCARYEWDMELAGSHYLGFHTKKIASTSTKSTIDHVLKSKPDILIREISGSNERIEARVSAFVDGFLER